VFIELGKSSRSEEPRLSRVFEFAVSVTFGAELVSILVIIGSLVSFFIARSGLLEVISFDIQLFLLLIATGIGFLILIVFAGLFIRMNEGLKTRILSARMLKLVRVTSEAKAFLALFGLALIFLCFAGVYGYYLLWRYVLVYYVGEYLSLTTLFFALGIILVQILAQLIIALVSRFVSRTVKS
jgi:hypothetical protein